MLTTVPMLSATAPPRPTERPDILRVLVVDDDMSLGSTLSEILRRLGFAVSSVDDTAAARVALKAHASDIVLLNLRLPGGGGLPLIEEIRTFYPETVVVVMTGEATVSSAVEAIRTGAAEYLSKPFSVDELFDALQRACERRHFDAESRRLREHRLTADGYGMLIGRSGKVERVYRIVFEGREHRTPGADRGRSRHRKRNRRSHYSLLWAKRDASICLSRLRPAGRRNAARPADEAAASSPGKGDPSGRLQSARSHARPHSRRNQSRSDGHGQVG